jgi:16S rRNA (guanine966-N2)-methyltransferase
MRIIAGKYKGRTISTIEGNETRPVMDRIKETIFNILIHRYSVIDIEVLDLFAGSGSFGLESLSRGAKQVTFVEKSTEAIKYLQSNINKLKCNDQCLIKNMSVDSFLGNSNKRFDLVFYDPPFKMINPLGTINRICQNNILSEESILIFRSERKSTFTFDNLKVEIEKVFGRNVVYFLRTINTMTGVYHDLQSEISIESQSV